jgi:hypothetical protein
MDNFRGEIMDVFYTLAFLVLFGSIIIFFSQEFIHLYKKILALSGMIILLPLLIASIVIMVEMPIFEWVLYYYQRTLFFVINKLANWLPFSLVYSQSLIALIVIWILSSVPAICMDYFHRKKFYHPAKNATFMTPFIAIFHWVLCLSIFIMLST